LPLWLHECHHAEDNGEDDDDVQRHKPPAGAVPVVEAFDGQREIDPHIREGHRQHGNRQRPGRLEFVAFGIDLAHAVGLSDELKGRSQHADHDPDHEARDPEIEALDAAFEAKQQLRPAHRPLPVSRLNP
jgi:hypothetical protein